MKICKTCGRAKHKGLCDMAELDNGHIVHASRIRYVTDAGIVIETGHVEGVLVKNRWRKDMNLGGQKKK